MTHAAQFLFAGACLFSLRSGAAELAGGAGALASKCITSCEVIAFEDLGCESVKRLEFRDFPLVVGIDCEGGSLFVR